MGFGFEPAESVEDGVRRMCLEQIDKAVDELRAPESSVGVRPGVQRCVRPHVQSGARW